MRLQTTEKRWPPLESKRWAIVGASICFVIGSVCIFLFFITTPTQGWGPPVLLIYGPLLLGVMGLICGILAQRWYLIALNILPPLVFPSVMLFGTLLLGP